MKAWLKDTALVLAEILGGILMCLLFLVVSVAGFFWTLGKHLWKRDYSAKRQFKPIMRAFTLCNDCFANAAGGEMLNDIFKVKNEIVRFGKWYETISAVTGLLKIYEKDIWLRRFLKILGKNHCEEAPTEMQLVYYKTKFEK